MRRSVIVTIALVATMLAEALPAVGADRSDLVNLALGRVATQSTSSSYPGAAPAYLAVDGNTDGDYAHRSVAVTYRVTDAWWEVDLGSVVDIDHVVLWNRTDCCSDRLRHFHVFVSDVPFDVRDIKNTSAQDGVLDVFRRKKARESVRIPIERSGRYVRVQLDYVDAVLQLAEVEVMGRTVNTTSPPPGTGGPAAIDMTVMVGGDAADVAPGPSVPSGRRVKVRFHVTNTGGAELWGLWVNVPGIGTIPCSQRHLRPGESVNCSLRVRARPGPHSEVARAVMVDASGAETDVQTGFHYYVPETTGAAAQLEFLVDGLNGDVPAGPRFANGDILTFSYLVSNVGGAPLTKVRVSDDRAGVIACPSRTVAPGETMVCKRTWTGRLIETSNLATIRADGGVSDSERLYYHVRDHGREDALALVVTIDGADANTPTGPTLPAGSTATIRYVLTNRGYGTNLWSAEILDPRVASGQMHCSGGPTLGVGQSMVCNATITVTEGQWSNLVIGHAWSSNGPRIDASDKVHYYGMP